MESPLKDRNWVFLLGNERDTMADAVTSLIDESGLREQRIQTAQDTVKDLWSEVEITSWSEQANAIGPHEATGTTTVYSVQNDVSSLKSALRRTEASLRGVHTSRVGVTEANFLPTLSGILDAGLRETDGIGTMWNDKAHIEVSKTAVEKMDQYIDPSRAEDMGQWSLAPDRWDYGDIDVPDSFPGDEYLENLNRFYAHVRNPHWNLNDDGGDGGDGPGDNWGVSLGNNRIYDDDDEDIAVGGAPKYAAKHMEEAEDKTGETQFKELAYCFHFVEDVGIPLHTGAWRAQTKDLHTKIEDRINQEYDARFKDEVGSIQQYESVPDRNWYEPDEWFQKETAIHTDNLAELTHPYASDMVTSAVENPNDPLADCRSQTQQSLVWATKYTMGVIEKFDEENNEDDDWWSV